MTPLLRTASHPRREVAAARPSPLRAVERAPRAVRRPGDRRRLAVIGGGLLFVAVLGGNVAVQAQTTQGQFQLERLQATARQREARYQQLRLRVAELEAPQRVGERARQLGMVEPDAVTYLTPSASTSSGTGSGTAPATAVEEAAQSWAHVKRHLDGS